MGISYLGSIIFNVIFVDLKLVPACIDPTCSQKTLCVVIENFDKYSEWTMDIVAWRCGLTVQCPPSLAVRQQMFRISVALIILIQSYLSRVI